MINNRIPAIQFIFGINEKVVPEIFLTRSLNGTTGTATFRFKNPNILKIMESKNDEIIAMYLVGSKKILETRDIQIRFINGKPDLLEAVYIMKNKQDWNYFITFIEKYSQINELIFNQPLK
jgi:photosystem II protein